MVRTHGPGAIGELFARRTPIDEALRDAMVKAVREHRRAGRPVPIWRDGRVVELRGEEIDRELVRALGTHLLGSSVVDADGADNAGGRSS
ncbi:MAG TPA: hypothetical protein VG370_28335 [Chloroflexota bacterium]|jgi:hypothetical protein|nr:hypothetical protein [Chloroflexota bacterium]